MNDQGSTIVCANKDGMVLIATNSVRSVRRVTVLRANNVWQHARTNLQSGGKRDAVL